MKKLSLALVLSVVVCAGCATRYSMTLSNGEVITTKGKPHLSADKNEWLFTAANGQAGHIPAGGVSQISPQSMDNDDKPNKFNPVSRK